MLMMSVLSGQAGMHAVRKNRYVILPKDFEKVCNPFIVCWSENLMMTLMFSGLGIRQRSWHQITADSFP
jgi:hypothetical protein